MVRYQYNAVVPEYGKKEFIIVSLRYFAASIDDGFIYGKRC